MNTKHVNTIIDGHELSVPAHLMPADETTPTDPVKDKLVDALLIALPYVEDCENSSEFKPGVVKKHVATIRAALALAGAV